MIRLKILENENNVGYGALIPSRMDIMIISEGIALNGKKRCL